MKTNSSLKKFMTNELSTEECKSIKAGWGENDPRNNTGTTTTSGSGSVYTGEEECFYDFNGELLYCVNVETGQITRGNR